MLLSLYGFFWPEPTPPGVCDILLEDGSSMLLEDGTSILLENCVVPPAEEIGGGGRPYIDWRVKFANEEYEKAKERERIKEEEIIRMKLEAQELLVRKSEIKTATDKQTKRQIAALEKEYAQLQLEIAAQLLELDKLHKNAVIQKNNVAFILLTIACPFSRFI